VPSTTELGFPIDFTVWTGLFAPAKTPDAAVAKLSAAVSAAANDPTFKEAMERAGTQMAYLGRDDFRAYLAKQLKDVSAAVAAIGPGPRQ
jgi:tripartite-type tricarboxylate transporter receptor subunit TctC